MNGIVKTTLKVSEIKNNPNNPRLIKDDKFKKLVQSLKQLPIMLEKRPVIIDENNVIIGGNMRHKAAKEAGLKEVPVETFTRDDAERNNIEAKKLNPDYIDKSYEEQVKEMVIKDNVSGGEWDWDLLANEWDAEELDEWGLDTPDDWGDDKEVDEDEAPEVDESEPPKSKLGEIYQLGRHRVGCMDSTVKENVEKLMDGNKADMVFTDPPYGIDLDTDNTKISSGWTGVVKGATNKKYSKVINDNIDYDAAHIFRDFDYVKEIFLWGANYFANTLPNLTKSSWIVWDKTNDSTIYTIGSEFELLWSKQKHRQEIIKTRWAGAMGTETQDTKKRIHPTQKPLECLTPIVNKYSGPKALIIDLFLGSGSTMVACHQTGRTCYAAEIDPRYVDVSIKRMLKLDPSLELKCNGKIIDKTPWLA